MSTSKIGLYRFVGILSFTRCCKQLLQDGLGRSSDETEGRIYIAS